MINALDLPDHYHTEIVELNPTKTARGFDAAAAFFSLLDELKFEVEASPHHSGFYHNRALLLKAYGEKRMYGLCAFWSEEMLEHRSFDDLVFVTNTYGMVHRLLPCFIVLEKAYDGGDSVCTFLWTAKRARNKGMAKYLLDFFDVHSTDLPLPEAEAFWTKHFARVQAEIDANDEEEVVV
jgi:hypothetical protein